MANRILSDDERKQLAEPILSTVRKLIDTASNGDPELRFALNRKISKELVYDERSKPMDRKKLKKRMTDLQQGKCADCKETLPASYNVLDRFNAKGGYVEENVRLICEVCDRKTQASRGFR